MRKTVITIEDEKDTVKVDTVSDECVHSKNIAPIDLIRCLNSSVSKINISTGLLPPNTISAKLGDRGFKEITLLYPRRRANITYYQEELHDFPLPQLVFTFLFREDMRIESVKIGVTDACELLNQDSKMYCYPFSNVYQDSRVCWGANEKPRLKSILEAPRIMDMLLEMPNNDDLFSSSHNQLGMNHWDLLKHLAGKDPDYYYSDVLVPAKYTLGKFLGLECE